MIAPGVHPPDPGSHVESSQREMTRNRHAFRRTALLSLAGLLLAAAASSEPAATPVGPSFGRAGGLGLVAWSEHAGEAGETPPALTAVDLATGELVWSIGTAGELAGTVCVETEVWFPQLRRLVSRLAIETAGGRLRLQGRLEGRQGVFELDAADGRAAAFEPAALEPTCGGPPEPRLRELGSLEVPADRGTFRMEHRGRDAIDLIETTPEKPWTVVRRSRSVFRRLWHGPGDRLIALISDLGPRAGMAAWSYRLALLEPRTQEILWYSAPLPPDPWHVWLGEETVVAVFGSGYVLALDAGSGRRLDASWSWPSLVAAARLW